MNTIAVASDKILDDAQQDIIAILIKDRIGFELKGMIRPPRLGKTDMDFGSINRQEQNVSDMTIANLELEIRNATGVKIDIFVID